MASRTRRGDPGVIKQPNYPNVLRDLDYATLELLVEFRRTGSFAGVAKQMKYVNEKFVRTRLKQLDASLIRAGFSPLLEAPNTRRWVLTPHGVGLAEAAEAILIGMRSALTLMHAGRPVHMVMTSNCCKMVATLIQELSSRGITGLRLETRLERSDAVDKRQVLGTADLAMFSTLLPIAGREREVMPGSTIPMAGGQMLVVEIEEIYFLTSGRFPGVPFPTVADILDANVTLCVPDSGVAWDYAQIHAPEWHERRFRQCYRSKDLHGGIQILQSGLAGPQAGMFVHGIELDDPRLQGLPDRRGTKMDDDPNQKFRAVTGLFAASGLSGETQTVWNTAQSMWGSDQENIRREP